MKTFKVRETIVAKEDGMLFIGSVSPLRASCLREAGFFLCESGPFEGYLAAPDSLTSHLSLAHILGGS